MKSFNRVKAPSFKQVEKINFLDARVHLLNNGITMYSISGGSEEVLKIDFIFKAGKWFQAHPLVAFATNKLMQEGTESYTSMQIAEGIDQYGAFLETAISYDNATITVYTLSKHLYNVLPYVKEIITCPVFSEHEFEIFKKNNLEKFKINLEKVDYLAQTEFMQLVFGKQSAYGTKTEHTNFEQLSLTGIKNFHVKHYNLNFCTIIIAGKVDDNAVEIVNQHFGNISVSNKQINNEVIVDKTIEKTKSKLFIKKNNALQSAIRIGRTFPSKTHPDYFGLQILNTILGGYFGSRLMKNIREEKGYSYGIGSGVMALQQQTFFYISTEVGVNVTNDALIEIYKELEILRTEKIKHEELELVKNYLLGQLLRSCDGPFSMASLFESVHFFGLDYSFYNSYIEKIKSISAEELLLLAQQYLNKENMVEVVVGNR